MLTRQVERAHILRFLNQPDRSVVHGEHDQPGGRRHRRRSGRLTAPAPDSHLVAGQRSLRY